MIVMVSRLVLALVWPVISNAGIRTHATEMSWHQIALHYARRAKLLDHLGSKKISFRRLIVYIREVDEYSNIRVSPCSIDYRIPKQYSIHRFHVRILMPSLCKTDHLDNFFRKFKYTCV